MWYFAWILGIGFACAFGIINAMWLEAECDMDTGEVDALHGSSR
ncbi:cytochrome bd-I oxidase subunit CydX [Methylocaldum sp. MU1018]